MLDETTLSWQKKRTPNLESFYFVFLTIILIKIKEWLMTHDIENDYYTMDVVDFIKKYSFPDYASVKKTARSNGWKIKNLRWTAAQIEKLKKLYPNSEWNELLSEFFPFDKEAIIKKAFQQKITRSTNQYTQEELDIMRKNSHLSTVEIVELLPTNRSVTAIDCKMNRDNVVRRAKWSKEEKEILVKHYSVYSNKELSSKFLPHRTESAIVCEAEKLGLKKNKKITNSTDKEKRKIKALEELRNFALQLGRTPTLREVGKNKDITSPVSYNRYFGSYATACELAGLEINKSLFGKASYISYSLNNDICYSNAEKKITDIFIENNITYTKEVPYSEFVNQDLLRISGKKRCDWLINNSIVVEFFGFPEKEEYAKKMKEKINICNDSNIPIIELFDKDVDRVNKTTFRNKFLMHGIKLNI